ncbi:MAG: M28 family peptidase [Acidobacteria bacterium]|nr:M28 family peptidase [Acidobacteriota bacterium]
MKNAVTARLCALLLALVLCGLPSSGAELGHSDPGRYIEHVKWLAAPERKGRGAGMPELEEAGRYIADEFRAYGLRPGVDGTSFLQPFQVTTGGRMGPDNRFIVTTAAGEMALKPSTDYLPINFSSAGSFAGEVVFAGYGISAEEFDYDDYTHFDVTDKIVMVLRYEPGSFKQKRRGARREYSHHSHLISKAINARDRGAKAVIIVNGELSGDDGDELVKFGGISGPEDAGIAVLHVKNSVADGWLQRAGTSLAELQEKMNAEGAPHSMALLDVRLSVDIDIEREKATLHNVVGYLPGKSDEYVILGAHYDHLGLGDQSSLAPSQIGTPHLGADDNASGTAGLLELARVFSERRDTLERGVLFLAFSGEEIGLLGSAYWVENPTLPVDKAVAMLNMDMIGRMKSKLYIGGTGTGSTFKDLLNKMNGSHPFELSFSESGYTASDHTSFLPKEIPVLFFFSGLHGDYHKPSDSWEKIDAARAAKAVDLISRVASELIATENEPEYRKVTSSEGHGESPSGGGGGGYGPYFGSVPDFAPVESGVKFADVRAGSPAGKAGLLAGDILTQFGDKPIKNLYDFTYALRASEVGDVVEVRVLRGDATVTATVTLEPRR